MEKLKQMKEALVGCVQTQIYGNLEKVDTKELGEAVDMIKDLAEAIYYCTITEAMEKEEKEGGKGQHGMMYYNPRMMPMEYYDPRLRERYMPGSMYAQGGGGGSSGSGGGGSSGSSGGGGGGGSRNARGDGGYDASARGNNARGGGTRGYMEGMMPIDEPWYPMYYEDMMYTRGGNQGGGQGGGGGRGGNRNYPPMEMMKDPQEGRSGECRTMYMEGKGMKDKTQQMKELENYMQELSQDLTEMIQDASPEEKQLLQQKISTLATKIK